LACSALALAPAARGSARLPKDRGVPLDLVAKPVLGKLERLQKLMEEDLTRVHRGQTLTSHRSYSVIVHDLDRVRLGAAPLEAYTVWLLESRSQLGAAC
jgi:hypothetical protein